MLSETGNLTTQQFEDVCRVCCVGGEKGRGVFSEILQAWQQNSPDNGGRQMTAEERISRAQVDGPNRESLFHAAAMANVIMAGIPRTY